MRTISAVKAEEHLKLVHLVVNRLRNNRYIRDLEELEGEGFVGLVKAANKFDTERGMVFSTYAVPMIHGQILLYLRDRSRIIKAPRRELETYHKIVKHQLEDQPDEEIAKRLNTTVKRVGKAREVPYANPTSLDVSLPDEDNRTYGETLPDHADYTVAEVNEFLSTLPPRNARIIRMRMAGLTQAEIAQRVGVTQVQVSRIIAKIGKLWQQQNDLIGSKTP